MYFTKNQQPIIFFLNKKPTDQTNKWTFYFITDDLFMNDSIYIYIFRAYINITV